MTHTQSWAHVNEQDPSHFQLVAADVVDDEDVESHSQENDTGDADDLEGLVKQTRLLSLCMPTKT